MKSVGHLTAYTVQLEVQSPLFIGSGETINKKEYLYIPKENKAVMFDLKKMATYLQEKNLIKQYQTFLMNEKERDLEKFFRLHNISSKEYARFTDYTIDMEGESVQGDKPMRELHLFVKDAQGNPYIPGSSLKGALRTAMLVYQIYATEKNYKEKREIRAKKWIDELNQCNASAVKRKLGEESQNYEATWLNRLGLLDTKSNDMVNSVMRGISVSDSLPIEKKQLMLVQKIDSSVKGNIQYMPLFRECLKPGTRCQCTITIDERIAEQTGWTIDRIIKAINFFRQWQEMYFYKKFNKYSMLDGQNTNVLWLGGGVGFENKTINQVSIGTKEALNYNAELLSKLFQNGHHEKDIDIGISPHMMKIALYKGKYYPMGQCKLEVLDSV